MCGFVFFFLIFSLLEGEGTKKARGELDGDRIGAATTWRAVAGRARALSAGQLVIALTPNLTTVIRCLQSFPNQVTTRLYLHRRRGHLPPSSFPLAPS
jgi:hypothetical protein